ncbi:ACP S-malonyltransferase [Helicobacter sp. MIT 14-3879]|uniref:ACP S-malonyltransferase n=1 Tax=Helicobacter sp. MIT 14-3879 TaxID=2040649 RepID=UPI000E1EEB5E|nr:ACP S-malonyltransferase [Helicobacter sp. MIT 14-3879]RDU63175.1 [acyl-carrier-protein] S-malonyltransferase [Helicobacter sp. MIT 14-3879]
MKFGFIFPGQGSQAIGMGKDFYEDSVLAKELFECSSEILKVNMKNLLFNENDDINNTQFTQPSILLISYIAYKYFNEHYKILPSFGLGHSLGEISANLVANSISFENAIKLVFERGKLMQKACEGKEAGMAVVIGLDDKILNEFCANNQNIWYANYNSDGQSVIAGKKEDLLNIESQIKKLGAKRFLILPMSIASHCPLLEGIVNDFKLILEEYLFDNFDFKIISNATMESYDSKNKAIELLSMQLTKPVLYKQSILKTQDEVDCFIEFGYGGVLKGLNKRLSSKATYSIGNLQNLKETIEKLKELER